MHTSAAAVICTSAIGDANNRLRQGKAPAPLSCFQYMPGHTHLAAKVLQTEMHIIAQQSAALASAAIELMMQFVVDHSCKRVQHSVTRPLHSYLLL